MKTLIAAALVAAIAAPASALATFAVGDTQTIDFAGFTDAYSSGTTALPGLTAALTLKLTGISGRTASFDYTLANTSTVEQSRVSLFGFDVATGGLVSATSTGLFNRVSSGNWPSVGGVQRDSDLCFRSANGGQCTGGGGGGVFDGQSGAGTLAITFASAPLSVALDAFHVRFQSIDAGAISGGSGVGDQIIPTDPTGSVPEPASWAMLIAGFGIVGASMRRRRDGPVRTTD